MLCESIRPLIRTFLDDLLDEKDYQDIQAHLSGCERCRAYASSVGTLSYRLYELGQVSVPPDMSSIVLYGFEKQRQAAPIAQEVFLSEEKSAKDMTVVITRLFWAVVVLILMVTVVAVTMIAGFWRSQKEDKAAADLPVSAPVSEPSETLESVPTHDVENLE